jgi:uncharacterized repeat protein (TIGR01451 family)
MAMSQRSRSILIVVILLLLIAGGGVGIYFFSQRLPTGVSLVTDSTGGTAVPLQGFTAATGGIPWLDNCTRSDPGATYNQQFGHSFQITYTCTNSDQESAHSMTLKVYDLQAPVFYLPDNPAVCLDPDDRTSLPEWPPFYDENTITPHIANAIFTGQQNWSCEYLEANNPNGQRTIQDALAPKQEVQLDFAPGETKTFSVDHAFPKCDYYQYDDMVFDENYDPQTNPGAYAYLVGRVQRSFGAPASCGYVVPQADLGNLEIRVWEEVDQQGGVEYTTPAAGGTDNPFPGVDVALIASNGQDVTAQYCDQGRVETGGAGRLSCFQLPVGKYKVTLGSDKPNAATFNGPLEDSHANPSAGELHNSPNPTDTNLEHTVVTAPAPTGDPTRDVVTYYDFGYSPKIVSGGINCVITAPPANSRHQINTLVSFDATVGGTVSNPVEYTWDFKDGQPPVVQNVAPIQHQFGTSGQFNVALGVEDSAGQTASCNVPIEIIQGPIVAAFECTITSNPDPARGQKPLSVDFNSTLTPSPTTFTPAFAWNFGDASIPAQSVQNPTPVSYANAGNFSAVLTVTNSSTGEQIATCNKPVEVLQGPIVAAFECVITSNPDPARGQRPLSVDFNSTLTPTPVGFNPTFAWDFGDATIPSQSVQNPSPVTYASSGNFTATLTVSSPTEVIATCTKPVQVLQGPIIPGIECTGLTATPSRGNRPLYVVFNATYTPTSTPVQYTWNYGDNTPQVTTLTGTTSHTYQNAGTYTAVVTIATTQQDPQGQDTCQTVITVTNPPTGEFTCDLTKTVSDSDETNVKQTNSQPGEILTYTISWTCQNYPDNLSGFSFTLTDNYPPLVTIVPGSITPNGVDNPSTRTIVWTITGNEVPSGSKQFKAQIDSGLAPGTYTLPNFVTMVQNGVIIDQDQTVTIVVVPEGPQVPDIEVAKVAADINGGVLLPGDVVQYTIVVWNNGNVPLTNVRVTENIPANVNSFTVTQIPQGATDNSTPTGGSNNTGFLDVSGFDLTNRGDTASIVYRVTVDQGVPAGTVITNLVTAASGTVSDTDNEDVTIGSVVAVDLTPVAPGPTPSTVVPPALGARVVMPPPTGAPKPTVETGVGAWAWALLASIMVAVTIAGSLYVRYRMKPSADL